jgi:hypothetical protein
MQKAFDAGISIGKQPHISGCKRGKYELGRVKTNKLKNLRGLINYKSPNVLFHFRQNFILFRKWLLDFIYRQKV